MSLLTVAEQKTYMGISGTGSDRDTYITNEVIPAAQSELDSYLNRTLESAEDTYYIDYGEREFIDDSIFISNIPLTAVDSLKYLDGEKTEYDLIDGTDDTIDNSSLIQPTHLKLFKGYTAAGLYIKITCTTGYTTDTLPKILKQALKEIGTYIYKEGYAYDGKGILMDESQTKSSGGSSVTINFKELDLNLIELNKYILHNV